MKSVSKVSRLITCCALSSGMVYGQNAAILLQRMQTALGGSRIFQVRDIDWEVRAKVWDGAGHEAGFAIRRERIILPYQFRNYQDMHVSKDRVLHTRFYFDGKSGWGSFADMVKFSDMPVVPLTGAELDMVRKEVRGFWLNLWRAQGQEVSVSGPHTLRFLDTGDQSVRELELDPDTWLPLSGITEWMVVRGMKTPKHSLNHHGAQLVADIVTVTLKVNTGMKASDLARRPPDAR